VALVAALAVAGWAGCPAPARGEPPPFGEDQRAQCVASFDYVWKRIRDTYWDPGLGGLDWGAARDELRPRVEQAGSRTDARRVIQDLIERLGRSHFAIIPGELYEEMQLPAGGGDWDGTAGVEVRIVEGRALVTKVEPGSPAARAGVGPGWEVTRVGKRRVARLVQALRKQLRGSTRESWLPAAAVMDHLSGRVGQKVSAQFLDGRGRTVTCELELALRKGARYAFAYLPAGYVWLEARRLQGDVGYIAFNCFLDPSRLMPAFEAAVDSFKHAQGIVIDLRGNTGGIGGMAAGMAGWFVAEEDRCLATLLMRSDTLKVIVNPRLEAYEGRLVVLVDELSMSASEFLAGGLQGLGRACVVGSRSGGAALPSVIEKLPNGDGFQYAIGQCISSNGHGLEGVGVVPDVAAPTSRPALLCGRDPALEAALAWIRSHARQARPDSWPARTIQLHSPEAIQP
jgi:carboxyl-terminal processing protease